MSGLDLSGMEPMRPQWDTVETLTAFNYNLQFEPASRTFILNMILPLSGRKVVLPFEALEFANFVKNINGAYDQYKTMQENGSGAALSNPVEDSE